MLLTGFVLGVVLQFLAIVYILGKDLTLAPRYNFVYYPGVCALIGASLVQVSSYNHWFRRSSLRNRLRRRLPLVAGGISCVMVVTNLTFLKPFVPDRVATQLLQASPPAPTVLMVTEGNQDIALGLSLALAVEAQLQNSTAALWRFFPYDSGVVPGQAEIMTAQPFNQVQDPSRRFQTLNLWLIGPRWQPSQFPNRLQLGDEPTSPARACRASGPTSQLGVPHQHYRCSPLAGTERSVPSQVRRLPQRMAAKPLLLPLENRSSTQESEDLQLSNQRLLGQLGLPRESFQASSQAGL